MGNAITNTIDGRINGIINSFRARQNTEFSTTGRYFQGLKTHSSIPQNGQEVIQDRLNSKPTDQTKTWNNFGPINIRDCAITCNVYDGPLGKGYELVFEVIVSGKLWRRTINFGSETWREHDWIVVE